VLIPKRTVTEQNGGPAVWVVTGTKVARRPVVLGRDRLDQVEVRSGVVPGEALVINPPANLTDRGVVRLKGK
jgi:HlyD family secretion protein